MCRTKKDNVPGSAASILIFVGVHCSPLMGDTFGPRQSECKL